MKLEINYLAADSVINPFVPIVYDASMGEIEVSTDSISELTSICENHARILFKMTKIRYIEFYLSEFGWSFETSYDVLEQKLS